MSTESPELIVTSETALFMTLPAAFLAHGAWKVHAISSLYDTYSPFPVMITAPSHTHGAWKVPGDVNGIPGSHTFLPQKGPLSVTFPAAFLAHGSWKVRAMSTGSPEFRFCHKYGPFSVTVMAPSQTHGAWKVRVKTYMCANNGSFGVPAGMFL